MVRQMMEDGYMIIAGIAVSAAVTVAIIAMLRVFEYL
jgi:hypothetical protein